MREDDDRGPGTVEGWVGIDSLYSGVAMAVAICCEVAGTGLIGGKGVAGMGSRVDPGRWSGLLHKGYGSGASSVPGCNLI